LNGIIRIELYTKNIPTLSRDSVSQVDYISRFVNAIQSENELTAQAALESYTGLASSLQTPNRCRNDQVGLEDTHPLRIAKRLGLSLNSEEWLILLVAWGENFGKCAFAGYAKQSLATNP
jgi:hypothetical protein